MKGYVLKSKNGYTMGQAMPWYSESVNNAIVFPSIELAQKSADEDDSIIEVELSELGTCENVLDIDDGQENQPEAPKKRGRRKSKTAHNRNLGAHIGGAMGFAG